MSYDRHSFAATAEWLLAPAALGLLARRLPEGWLALAVAIVAGASGPTRGMAIAAVGTAGLWLYRQKSYRYVGLAAAGVATLAGLAWIAKHCLHGDYAAAFFSIGRFPVTGIGWGAMHPEPASLLLWAWVHLGIFGALFLVAATVWLIGERRRLSAGHCALALLLIDGSLEARPLLLAAIVLLMLSDRKWSPS